MSDYPVRPATHLLSIEEQNENILKDVLSAVRDANTEFSGTRVITASAAKKIASRSLEVNAGESYSVRRHRALAEVSSFTTLLQRNRVVGNALAHADLLPIAHPRSTRDHELTGAELSVFRARWVTDDPHFTDDAVRSLVASALTSHPASTEYEYAISRLQSMPQGTVPQYALVAALGDGNSSAARRARAMLQRRDRYGRFAEMGGGLKALIRMANKVVRSLSGRALVQGIDKDTFDMELPDGKIVRLPATSTEAVKALLPTKQTKDGYSKTPAKVKAGDPILNAADVEIVDAPDGFNLDESWSPSADDVENYGSKIDLGKKYTDDAYDVIKFDKPNAKANDAFEILQQKEAEGQNIVTVGKGKNNWLDPNLPVYFVSRRDGKDKTFAATQSWADALEFIKQDEPKYENNEMVDPVKKGAAPSAKPKTSQKKKATLEPEDVKAPEGFYEVNTTDAYIPEGAIDGQESPDFTDDPVELAQRYDANELRDALEESVKGTTDEPGTGFGFLPFEGGDEAVPAEALYSALNESGEDAKAILDEIYSGPDTEAPQAPDTTEPVTDEVKEAINSGDLPDAPDVVDAPSQVPPLIDGLTDDEKQAFLDNGDYKPYLPKNDTFDWSDIPDGYSELSPKPFDKDNALLPEDAPDGFSLDPVDIANNYDTEALKAELRRALEPGNEMPGYGILGQETPEGEKYLGNVPGEAIRDALQLKGEDTNALTKDIYDEGKAGQDSDAPTPDEVKKALEGEKTEGAPATEEAPAEAPQQPAEDAEGPSATEPKAGLPTDSGAGQEPPSVGGAKVGEPEGPARLTAKTKDLKPGDVTVGDNFVIESVEPSDVPGKSWITGYYPGHVSQKTKLWNNETGIDVYRNVEPPQKGDLPELSKPFAKDYGPVKKASEGYEYGPFHPKDPDDKAKYEADWDAYNESMAQAKEMWSAPEDLEYWNTEDEAPIHTVENPVGVKLVPATAVEAGDLTFKKEWGKDQYEYFVVESVSTDADGNAVVQGYYPGHKSQTKTWKGSTKIAVLKGLKPEQLPQPGEKPALERPSKDDPDYAEKKAAFDAGKAESAASYDPPVDLDSVDPNKSLPQRPTPPAFAGEKLKAIAAQAGGDPKKFKELLQAETVYAIDFETSANGGFNTQNPIQVAIYKRENGEVVDSLVLYMNPEEPLGKFYTDKNPDDILKDANGNPISDAFLADQMSMEDAFAQILEFMGENPIVMAHNMPFDGAILKRISEKYGLDYSPGGEIDTLSLSRKVINGGKGDHELHNVAKRYGLADESTDWHDATVDAAVLPEMLDKLLDEMATTNSGIEQLDPDKASADYLADIEGYEQAKILKKKAESELVVVNVFNKGMADGDVPSLDQLIEDNKDLPEKEESSSATESKAKEVSDGDFGVESVLGGTVSNNWVEDDENTELLGRVAVENWKPGDFIEAKFGGWHEIISLEDDPDDDKRMLVTRRLLSNGKQYTSSWIKYQPYIVRRRNDSPEIDAPDTEAPEVIQPVEAIDEAPEKEADAGKWQGYNIAQGTDGVYYAEGISGSDVQKLRNGELTPPQLPFFAPLGGGDNQETGEGYFFSVNGKRFWGKYGAAGALLRRKNSDGTYEYFLAKRSKGLSQGGGKWALPGGAHKDQTTAKTVGATAKEEFTEEVGGNINSLDPVFVHNSSDAPDWSYDTYVFEVGPGQFDDLNPTDGENSQVGWFSTDQLLKMQKEEKLHPSFSDSLDGILALSEDNTSGPDKPTPSDEVVGDEVSAVFDTSEWKKIGGQAGSNEGAFYVDPKTGDQYYVKVPKSDAHAANEVLASALYEEAGTKVGRVFLGKDKKGNTVLVSPLVPNTNPDFGDKKSDPDIKSKAQEDFIVDAWLNNWDSVGLVYDNMLTDNEGNVYRIDPGGSLLFRAQGKDKKSTLTPEVTQIDSLRDPSVNPQAADIFGDMTDEQLAESAKKVQAISPEKIDELVDAAFPDDAETAEFLKDALKKRREDIIQRFGLGEKEEEQVEIQTVSSPSGVVLLDVNGDIAAQIASAIENNQKVAFNYKGKDRIVYPVKTKEGGPSIWENQKNGKIHLRAVDSDGVAKNFTIANIQPVSDGFNAPVSDAPEADTPETPEAPEAPTVKTPEVDVPDPEPDADPQPAEKPTDVPEAEKQKVIDDLSNLAESVFGKAPDKEQLKALLGTLKEQGGNPDLIDSAIESLDAPEPKELDTPEEKVAEDIAQDLVPQDPELPSTPLSTEDIEKALSNPDETNPELIWKAVKEDYDGTVLSNGHIVVHSVMHGDDRYDVVVRRNETNSFEVYHRITAADGSTKVYWMSKKHHSAKALGNTITTQIGSANSKPKYIKSKSKGETDKTLLPTSMKAIPTEAESYVAADGSTLKKGDTINVVNPTHSKFGQKGVIKGSLRKYKTKGYGYTDYLKVKYEDGEINTIVSKSVTPETSGWKWGDPVSTPEATEAPTPSAPTPTPTPTPEAPSAPEADTTPTPEPAPSTGEASSPFYSGPSLEGATDIKEVLKKAATKNDPGHLAYFGADSYSDYKNFLSGMFLKDPESKNMVPGMIVSNASPGGPDPELTSHGVITNMDVSKGEVQVGYFDGPLAGKTQTLKNDKVWSRENLLTIEQAKELGIDVDPTYLNKSLAESKKKKAAYEKELLAKKKKAELEAAEKAMKADFEVEGAGFELATPANVEWNFSPIDDVPPLTAALTDVKGDNATLSTNGVAVLGDADEIEDMSIKVQKVVTKGNKKQIRLTFKLTGWKGNNLVQSIDGQDGIEKSSALQIPMWEKEESGLLKNISKMWKTGSKDSKNRTVDQYENGTTYTGQVGKGTFRLHRASKDLNDENVDFTKNYSNSKYSVAFHNDVEILLPENATEADITEALEALGIKSARPATPEDIKGLIENKMIWLLGKHTDGKKNYKGELRKQKLQQIQDEWGFTADDVEVVQNPTATGTIEFLMPESVAKAISDKVGIKYFYHNTTGGFPNGTQAQLDYLYDIFMSGGLYATAKRWNNGLNMGGMSSSEDIRANGGNYIFTYKGSSKSNGSNYGSPTWNFDATKLLRRMGYYSTGGDYFGQLQGTDHDVVEKLKNASQIMFKANLTWADLAAVDISPELRKMLIEKLTQSGKEVVNGVNLVDILKGGK
jgi:DNA polymerase III epsilon subunit-like protein/ADP-ribose pyrophosphatase YjhB (NUDIX family)